MEILSGRTVECSVNGLPVPLSRIVLKPGGCFVFEVLYGGYTEHGQCGESLLELKPFLERMVDGCWKYCPGMLDYKNRYGTLIRFQPSKLRLWNLPLLRVDSRECKILFELSKGAPRECKLLDAIQCSECKRF